MRQHHNTKSHDCHAPETSPRQAHTRPRSRQMLLRSRQCFSDGYALPLDPSISFLGSCPPHQSRLTTNARTLYALKTGYVHIYVRSRLAQWPCMLVRHVCCSQHCPTVGTIPTFWASALLAHRDREDICDRMYLICLSQ